MLDLGLSAAESRMFHRTLGSSHKATTSILVLDRDEHTLLELPDVVTAGAVHIDQTQPIDRSLELELVDGSHRFQFIPNGASDFSLFADNYLRAVRSVWVDDLSRWVHVPCFTGPITTVSRDQDTVSITAVGKESLALKPALGWRPRSYPKGSLVTAVIHDILYDIGERKFDLPSLQVTTRTHVTLGRNSEPWRVASRLAASIDRQLFYDGRGKLRLRIWPGPRHSFTFRDGDGGNILTKPSMKIDMGRVRNTVEALGPKPDGPQKRLRWVAYPPQGHPLSPWSLARNGEPRFLVETVELDHAHRLAQVRAAAERKLADLLKADLEVNFDALPVPHLEPGDFVAVNQDGEVTSFRLKTFSLPLVGTDPMSVGTTRRVSRHRNRRP